MTSKTAKKIRGERQESLRELLSNQGHIQHIIDLATKIEKIGPKEAKKLVFCTGKFYYDLLKEREERGINERDWVGINSRSGDTVLRAKITNRVQPGVVYTTFHHPVSGANVITTDNSDWATNCPEFKVTAVQVTKVTQPSNWQSKYQKFSEKQIDFVKNGEEKVS